VHYKIYEGGDQKKFRLQPYEGIVMRYRKGTAGSTFTVRKISAVALVLSVCFQSIHHL